MFDIAPRRPIDLDAPPPVLPAGIEHLDLAEVTQAVAAWRAQKTAPAPVAAADNQQTPAQWSSFLDRMKGLKAS